MDTFDNALYDGMTADELAYEYYLNGKYTYEDYCSVCDEEGTDPLPPKRS